MGHTDRQMTNAQITLRDTFDAALVEAIRKPLSAYNVARTGVPVDYKPLIITIDDPENGVLGGMWGFTYYSYLYIDLLFIPESLRGSGMGKKLMAQAEEEAVRRQCRGIWLDTFSWQARGFYEKLGYSVFATFEDHPPGHQRYFLRKVLQA